MPRRKATDLPTYGPQDLGDVGTRAFPAASGVYQIQFRDTERRPQRKTRTLRTRNPGLALERGRDLVRKRQMGTFDPWREAATHTELGEAFDLYVGSLRRAVERGERKPSTRRHAEQRVGWLLARTGRAVALSHVDPADVAAVVRAGPRGPRSAASRHSLHVTLAGFFNWCVREGLVSESPMAGMASPPRPDRTPDYLTRAQVDQWIAAVERAAAEIPEARREMLPHAVLWIRDACLVALYTGLRLGEVCALTWADVERGPGGPAWLRVRETVGRGGRHSPKWESEGRVPVPPPLLPVLARMEARRQPGEGDAAPVVRNASGGEVHPEQLSRGFKRYARAAKLPGGLSFHSLRHSYASWLVMGGKAITTVRDLMRHRDVSTTQVYAHLSPEHLQASVNDVFSEGPSGSRSNVSANAPAEAEPSSPTKTASPDLFSSVRPRSSGDRASVS